jgi:hypothetical protein
MDIPERRAILGTQDTGRRQTNQNKNTEQPYPTKTDGKPMCSRRVSSCCLLNDTCRVTHNISCYCLRILITPLVSSNSSYQ